jgi:hypothetical protein
MIISVQNCNDGCFLFPFKMSFHPSGQNFSLIPLAVPFFVRNFATDKPAFGPGKSHYIVEHPFQATAAVCRAWP